MLNWLSGRRADIDTLISRRQYAKAVKAIEERLEEEPDNAFLRQQLADVLDKDGQTARAVDILFQLVAELARDGYVSKGMAVLKKIQRLDPEADVGDQLFQLIGARDGKPGGRFSLADDSEVINADGSEASNTTLQEGVAFATSEIVLTDWVAEAEQRDDFNWSPLLSNLSKDEMNAVFGDLRLVMKYPGAIIYAAGEPSTGIYVLASGSARVYEPDATGHCRQLMLIRGGDFFGIDSVGSGSRRRHTVTAATECELLQIDPVLFERLANRHPQIREHVEKIGKEMGL